MYSIYNNVFYRIVRNKAAEKAKHAHNQQQQQQQQQEQEISSAQGSVVSVSYYFYGQ